MKSKKTNKILLSILTASLAFACASTAYAEINERPGPDATYDDKVVLDSEWQIYNDEYAGAEKRKFETNISQLSEMINAMHTPVYIKETSQGEVVILKPILIYLFLYIRMGFRITTTILIPIFAFGIFHHLGIHFSHTCSMPISKKMYIVKMDTP